MSVSPAPEIPNPAEREGLVWRWSSSRSCTRTFQTWVVEGRSSGHWSNGRPWRARPPQEEQGVVVLFPTNSNASPPSSALRQVRSGPTVPLQSSQPHRPTEPVPLHSGHGRHQGDEGFSLDVLHPAWTAPHLWPHGPTSARRDHPGQAKPPRSAYQVGPSHVHPSITASRGWYAMVGRNANRGAPRARRLDQKGRSTWCRRGRGAAQV
jgi:hypothetical protein